MGIGDLCAQCTSLMKAELQPAGRAVDQDFGDTYRFHYFAVGDQEAVQALSKKEAKLQNAIRAGEFWDHYMKPPDNQQPLRIKAAIRSDKPAMVLVYSRRGIERSAKAGCHLCAMMTRICNQNPLSVHRRILTSVLRIKSPIIPLLMTEEYHIQAFDFHFIRIYSACTGRAGHNEVRSSREFTQTALPIKGITQKMPVYLQSLVSSDSIHPQTIQRIRSWLDACRNDHDCCKELSQCIVGSTPAQPRRVVEIRRKDSRFLCRLVEAEQLSEKCEHIEFTALSHCWGEKGIPCKLVMRKQAAYSRNIPWKKLPRTFRDAIDVTSLLGFQYIWIDALCIIQDSEQDWNEEAPRMAAIYSASAFCLAASSSQNPEGGLYTRNLSLAPCPSDTSWFRAADGSQRIAVRPMESRSLLHLNDEPLQKRAWTYQERQLALRTVIFGRDQAWWTCPGASYAELNCGETEGYDVGQSDPIHTQLRGRMILSQDMLMQTGWNRSKWSIRWMDIVKEYSPRALSHSKDRLIAMAGVAQTYAQLRSLAVNGSSGRYLAGLWDDENLLHHLLWTVHNKFSTISRSDCQVYVAPTWSWASTHGRIWWPIGTWRLEHNPNVRILASLVSTATGNPYGPVTSGEITLRLPLHLFDVLEFDSNIKAITINGHCLEHKRFPATKESKQQAGFWSYIDGRYPPADRADFTLFAPLCRDERFDEVQASMYGLLLSKAKGNKGVYRRVGMLDLRCPLTVCEFIPTYELIWKQSWRDLSEDQFLEKHEDGTYTIKII